MPFHIRCRSKMPGVFRTERAGRFCKQFVSIFFPNAPDKTKRTGRPLWQAAGPLFIASILNCSSLKPVGAEAVGQSSRVSLMISSKVRPRKSAALRQSTMRSRKISKYSMTGQMFVSIVTENTQSLFSASIFSEAFSTA